MDLYTVVLAASTANVLVSCISIFLCYRINQLSVNQLNATQNTNVVSQANCHIAEHMINVLRPRTEVDSAKQN
jgi:hypothetical protein